MMAFSLPAFCLVFSLALSSVHGEHAVDYTVDYDEIELPPHRDNLLEQLVRQFVDEIKEIDSLPIDPLKMWPVKESFAKKMYKGDIDTCNIYLHNIKGLEIKKLDIMRSNDMTTIELKISAHLPIVWMTGTYSLTNLRFLKLMKVRDKIGKFNVDLTDVNSDLGLTLKSLENGTLAIADSSFSLSWKDVSIRFHNLLRKHQSTRSKITKLLLNELGIGNIILQSKRKFIIGVVGPFIKENFRCFFSDPLGDLMECMNYWWEKQGFEDPWNWPECKIPQEYLDAEIEQ